MFSQAPVCPEESAFGGRGVCLWREGDMLLEVALHPKGLHRKGVCIRGGSLHIWGGRGWLHPGGLHRGGGGLSRITHTRARARMAYYEIKSKSGRCTSYWNAFLFNDIFADSLPIYYLINAVLLFRRSFERVSCYENCFRIGLLISFVHYLLLLIEFFSDNSAISVKGKCLNNGKCMMKENFFFQKGKF